jgi:peptidoglycan/LPS O-acetylase OafA/YrhL
MSSPAVKRIEFIDAVRGLAALRVMVSDVGEAWRRGKWDLFQGSYFDFGVAGVVAFFLVSGFIIPYSIEKTHSVWKFWIGRIFRIYPPLSSGACARYRPRLSWHRLLGP